jgi:hypothetical protein
MKIRLIAAGIVLCLGALVQGQTSDTAKQQSANRMKHAQTSVSQTLIGCVDQQNGQYVMRDEQTSQIINLSPTGTDSDTAFARFLGHKAQASGAKSGNSMRVTQIHQVADMCGTGR